MSPECREAMTNFLVNILHEMCRKMEAFREYETANSDGTKKSLRLVIKVFFIEFMSVNYRYVFLIDSVPYY